ncbi:hypothetical protein [Methylibium sp. T29-B]|uniref:hypothetical protein n=1 Tax=Methylibium sp. T29-B TaxID=1437443 RepID=UPI0012DD02A6|nr:hypothetical protein [Methylibium sp. T29-B]
MKTTHQAGTMSMAATALTMNQRRERAARRPARRAAHARVIVQLGHRSLLSTLLID